MSRNQNVSGAVIRRLPRYYRFLGELLDKNITRISSKELAELMSLTASQIRQDLNCFGGFGQQGYGYNVSLLREEIGKILGLDRKFKTILVGVGNLGRAFSANIDFIGAGFELCAMFDNNPDVIGTVINGVTVKDSGEIESFCSENKPDVAILCIPISAAHEVAETLVKLGVKGFWNFSHYDLSVDFPNIVVENVHLSDSLMTLSYNITHIDD